MPDRKISELTAVTTLAGTEEFPLSTGTDTKKITAADLEAAIGGGGGGGGGGPSSMELVETVVCAGGETSVTFADIPQDGIDLLLVLNVRSAAADYVYMRFNGDTGGNYEWQRHYALGGGGNASDNFSATGIPVGASSGTGTLYAGHGRAVIFDYTNAVFYKNVESNYGGNNGSNQVVFEAVGTWKNDDAITSITLIANSGSWVAGSRFSLYKLTEAAAGSGGGGVYVGAKVYSDSAQAISGGTATALTFNQEEYDSDGFHDPGTNPSRITIPAGMDGKYRLGAGAFFSDASDWIGFRTNGSTNVRGFQSTLAAACYRSVSAEVELAAGDYVEVVASASSCNVGHATLLDAQKWFAAELMTGGSAGASGGMVLVEAMEAPAGGSADFDFVDIPQDAADLLLILGPAKGENASNEVAVRAEFNGDTTAGAYAYEWHGGNGGSGEAGGDENEAAALLGWISAASNSARAGVLKATIPGYRSTFPKGVIAEGGWLRGDGSSGELYRRDVWSNWQDTDAITRVRVFCQSGDFVEGSTARLYKLG